jgi:hypothetical protein
MAVADRLLTQSLSPATKVTGISERLWPWFKIKRSAAAAAAPAVAALRTTIGSPNVGQTAILEIVLARAAAVSISTNAHHYH